MFAVAPLFAVASLCHSDAASERLVALSVAYSMPAAKAKAPRLLIEELPGAILIAKRTLGEDRFNAPPAEDPPPEAVLIAQRIPTPPESPRCKAVAVASKSQSKASWQQAVGMKLPPPWRPPPGYLHHASPVSEPLLTPTGGAGEELEAPKPRWNDRPKFTARAGSPALSRHTTPPTPNRCGCTNGCYKCDSLYPFVSHCQIVHGRVLWMVSHP